MKIRLQYDQMFQANDRDALTKTAMLNINAHQLAGLVRITPDLPEAFLTMGNKFDVEVEGL